MKVLQLLANTAAALSLMISSAAAGTFDQEQSLWQKSPLPNIHIDNQVKVAGSSSVRLSKHATATREFELKPDTTYELTFYIKGENVSTGKGRGARVMLFDGKKKWGRVTTRMNSGVENGTFDWRQGKATIKSSDWGGKIRIMLALRGTGTVWFDEVELKESGKEEKLDSFRKNYNSDYQDLALIPQGTLGFFDPGEKIKFKILYQSKAKNLEYSYTVKDENGKNIFTSPRKPLEKSFSLPGQPCGYYVVEADFYANNVKSRSMQSAFVVSRKFEKRDPFFQMGYGVNAIFYEGFKRLGVGLISMKFTFFVPTSPVEKLWKIAYDNYKPFLEGNEFELAAVMPMGLRRNRICRTEKELAEGWPYLSDKLLQHRKDYIDLILKKTKGKIKYVTFQSEISSSATIKNKYQGNWPEAMNDYLILARMGARQVRKFDPTIKIRMGGNNVQSCLRSTEPIVMGALINEFDQYIIDGYTGNWDLTKGKPAVPEGSLMSFYKESSQLAKSLGKSPIIGNEESGLSIHYGARFDRGRTITQAELTTRQLLISKVAPVSHYELHKPGNPTPGKAPKDIHGAMYTIWKPVWFGNEIFHIPLPGGAAYATAAKELSFVKKVDYFTVDQKYCAVYTRPDKSTLVVLWSLKNDQKFTFNFPGKVKMLNMYGRESTLPAGRTELKLGTAPIYLTVKMPAKVLSDELKAELQKQSPEFAFAGFYTAPGKAKLFIRNLTDEMKHGSVQGQKVSVLPGKIIDIELRKAVAEVTFINQNGKKYPIKIAPGNFQKVAKLDKKPIFDGSGSWLKGLPNAVLSYPDNIAPSAALQQELCYFKTSFNPTGHNVSAEYWVAYDKENFYLAVKVDDPIHQQRHNSNVWKDDSVQFVFAFGDTAPSILYHPAPAPRTTFNYGTGLTPSGPITEKYRGKDAGKKNLPVNITRQGNTTFYEICVPFAELGGKPDRFGFVIFDNNYPTKRHAPYWLEHSSGIAGGEDESKLKYLVY